MEESLLWIIDYYSGQNVCFKVKISLIDGFLFLFLQTHRFSYMWIIVMFLSAVWTLILTAPIHRRGSTGEQVMQC